MNREAIRKLLPHREPMLLIDEVELLPEGKALGKAHVRGDEVGVEGRREQGDDGLPGAQSGDLGVRGRVDLEDDVGIPDGLIDEVGAGLLIGTVVETGLRPSALLDEHGIPEGNQLLDGLGRRSDPAFAGFGLLGHTDAHGNLFPGQGNRIEPTEPEAPLLCVVTRETLATRSVGPRRPHFSTQFVCRGPRRPSRQSRGSKSRAARCAARDLLPLDWRGWTEPGGVGRAQVRVG